MYGCNKLYCEQLGHYYSHFYKRLAPGPRPAGVDFRAVRFPGLISADTVPSGGTSDYAPEMIHAAAKGEPYACFVRPDARIPFMAMPDGVEALLKLAAAPRPALTRTAYNLGAFAPSADMIRTEVISAFPKAVVTFAVDDKRQGIVDSWPEDVDDSAARRDWGFAPKYGFESAFREYLIPRIKSRYRTQS
jgi:nucleoside-diphosphate-sugar epimerase